MSNPLCSTQVALHPDILPHILSYLPHDALYPALFVSSTFHRAAEPLPYDTFVYSPRTSHVYSESAATERSSKRLRFLLSKTTTLVYSQAPHQRRYPSDSENSVLAIHPRLKHPVIAQCDPQHRPYPSRCCLLDDVQTIATSLSVPFTCLFSAMRHDELSLWEDFDWRDGDCGHGPDHGVDVDGSGEYGDGLEDDEDGTQEDEDELEEDGDVLGDDQVASEQDGNVRSWCMACSVCRHHLAVDLHAFPALKALTIRVPSKLYSQFCSYLLKDNWPPTLEELRIVWYDETMEEDVSLPSQSFSSTCGPLRNLRGSMPTGLQLQSLIDTARIREGAPQSFMTTLSDIMLALASCQTLREIKMFGLEQSLLVRSLLWLENVSTGDCISLARKTLVESLLSDRRATQLDILPINDFLSLDSNVRYFAPEERRGYEKAERVLKTPYVDGTETTLLERDDRVPSSRQKESLAWLLRRDLAIGNV
ncbi:hypothetical protein L198_04735 [Cryptococcus wingfieldii CBS 7118]|uniref:F-box domain-containing protein n=1 Tax=Cryptococcus wingfieldii CBS 7118 TaxID=1295528 RepID=A0A1E3J3A9_9TREE|nr:hypothetical protein L198_04735 [Cryptococcus wingfieldii CBS 7118]ODN95339.1 hypothetical protein L198_04735 [Cryptococcus wingfieldii CBS 7118]